MGKKILILYFSLGYHLNIKYLLHFDNTPRMSIKLAHHKTITQLLSMIKGGII